MFNSYSHANFIEISFIQFIINKKNYGIIIRKI